jgi:hypothetical protein
MDEGFSDVEEQFRARVQAALAHFDEGGPQIRTGGSDSGPALYDSAAQGWRLDVRRDAAGAARFYVDHVGAGRREALPMYLRALESAGLVASLAPVQDGSAKQVIWLESAAPPES